MSSWLFIICVTVERVPFGYVSLHDCMTICDTSWSWWTDARLKLFDNCKTLEFSRGKANKTLVEQVK